MSDKGDTTINGESLLDHDAFETASEADSDDFVGGIRLSSRTRNPKFVNSLPPYQSFQLRVWRLINGPLEEGDKRGHVVHALFQINAIAFIVLVILETEDKVYNHNKHAFDVVQRILAIIMTFEYFMSLWSVTANAEYASKNGRLRWAFSFLPFVDLLVITCYWTSEVMNRNSADALDQKIIKSFQTLRLLRLLRMLEVVESERVKKAFRLLYRVMVDKGEDIMASLIIMFISLIFIATLMYLVEGNNDQGFDSFESIPLSMYWGVITLTTIGYGDIYPRTTMGQVVCCFVGFFAVCIGGIPIGIIGAGYVEELERSRKEAKAAANRGMSFGDMIGHEAVHQKRAGKEGGKDANTKPSFSSSLSKNDNVALTLSGLRLHLANAADVEFLSALTQKEMEEVNELMTTATRELNSFVISELGILRRQHAKALAPI